MVFLITNSKTNKQKEEIYGFTSLGKSGLKYLLALLSGINDISSSVSFSLSHFSFFPLTLSFLCVSRLHGLFSPCYPRIWPTSNSRTMLVQYQWKYKKRELPTFIQSPREGLCSGLCHVLIQGGKGTGQL